MDAGKMNYIGLLNEFATKKGWVVDFQEETSGADHIRTFTMRVRINGELYPEGVGQKKKEAKQKAAKNALTILEKDELGITETSLETSTSFSLKPTQANFTCWLNEYSHKQKISFIANESTKMGLGSNNQICVEYACRYVCGDKKFPEAIGNSKKEAKEAAAKLVHESLTNQVLDVNGNGEENLSIQSLSLHNQQQSTTTDTENTSADVNFIGLLNQYCQKRKLMNCFRAVEKKGPAHVPEFAVRVVVNNKEYPEGRGRTMKEARQKAAQHALNELDDSDLSSQNSSPVSMSVSSYPSNLSERLSPVPVSHVKPKRQLAANFQNSPVGIKKQSNINALKIPIPSTNSPNTPVSSPTTKSRFLEEFDTISRIGKGGYGRVFMARRKLEDTTYAVKIVRFTDTACREVQALSRLTHANIVRYHSSWTEETEYRDSSDDSSGSHSGSGSKFLYIQMEFCEGETLKRWIEERNFNPEKYSTRRLEAADIIKQVLGAVKYIHSKTLFHRDLKPLNIMFGQDGGVKVGDFGLVSKEEQDDDGHLLERTQKVGTRSYMSPEQRLRQKIYDRKVDIYAAGLIFFELLWRFGTVSEKDKEWDRIRSGNFPKEFCIKFYFEHNLIKGMLCEDPANRPEASDLLTKLDQLFATTASTKHENRTY
ncbi:interferon-induced, double-stranded RNA-activated protein kinase [Tachysurus fulvidraco]|uniref:interferon-induced, double-stranded RNA-activated protein kinase n=1 Tax=Tachysurus fulvidraco TaxID=1234273 RepID=UPI001FEE13B3|nr:interferon-induced, double-stranded RNA-activated protein kinase [Tachysurus fulvidraco]